VTAALIKEGHVQRAYLGIAGQSVTFQPGFVRRFGLPFKGGVLVAEVVPGGPAARAGIQERDVVLSLAGQPTPDVDDIHRLLTVEAIGQPLPVQVLREDQVKELVVTPMKAPRE